MEQVTVSSIPRLLTQTELAKGLGVSRETLRLWLKQYPDFPFVRLTSKRYFRADEIKAWLDSKGNSALIS